MAITANAKSISDSIKAIPSLSSNSSHKYNSTREVVANVFDLDKENVYLYTLSDTSGIIVRSQQVQMQVNKGAELSVVIAVCTFDFKTSSGYAKYALELMNHYGVQSVLYSWKNNLDEYVPQLAFGIKDTQVVKKIKEVWPDLTIEEITANVESNNSEKVFGKNTIFFGAPGTGKSHRVKSLVQGKKERTVRVTFHPEFDYSSFVGGYKPTMDGENIRYEFIPQAFTKIYCEAWNSLAEGKTEDYYLIIEEINRGNCAEIFGDIFQLLDRDPDYDISPSKELKEFLSDEQKGLKNREFGLNGGKLLLPANLNILATMNTSDQSLFPMDSAFKRRWNWEYIPINYEESDRNYSSKYKVQLSENETFSWLSFIKAVNSLIKSNDNLGMDKCIGNYFVKPEDDVIELDEFINKVIFYLWIDVFKDEMDENNIFLNRTSYEDFFPVQTNGVQEVKNILTLLKVDIATTT